jgi:hypothetical protein
MLLCAFICVFFVNYFMICTILLFVVSYKLSVILAFSFNFCYIYIYIDISMKFFFPTKALFIKTQNTTICI